jgi:hypothetical protein
MLTHKFTAAFFLLLSSLFVSAQNRASVPFSPVPLYASLTHQHHDFYGKAFSYTGIEAGALFNRYFLLGLYGATFLSGLDVLVQNAPVRVWMRQAGLVTGASMNDSMIVHAGLLLNAGYVHISTDDPARHASGLVLDPQICGETNITGWMRFRMGIAYDLYALDRTGIEENDVRNFSINFALAFGFFKKSRNWFR